MYVRDAWIDLLTGLTINKTIQTKSNNIMMIHTRRLYLFLLASVCTCSWPNNGNNVVQGFPLLTSNIKFNHFPQRRIMPRATTKILIGNHVSQLESADAATEIDDKTRSTLLHLECGMCGKHYNADQLNNLCTECQRPLLARYDLQKAKQTMTPESLKTRAPTLWRYEEVLPIRSREHMLSLGEGWTMLHHAKRLGAEIGCLNTYIKDEGTTNPTGSFKARGLSVAVSRAYELGAKELSIPSAGNAAGAMSAYAAQAGLPAHVFMPKDVPTCFKVESEQLGATVTLVDGLINDCGAKAKEGVERYGRFDVSTLKEPYRLEGKKTMGYELAEQFHWELPDVIIYP